MEEKKAENELNMKREIRSLLKAYLQVKQRVEELEPVVGDQMQGEYETQGHDQDPMFAKAAFDRSELQGVYQPQHSTVYQSD